jgi:hypothetical protein
MSRLERVLRILLLFTLVLAGGVAPANSEPFPVDEHTQGQPQLFLNQAGPQDQGNRQEDPLERQRMIIVFDDPPQAQTGGVHTAPDLQRSSLKQQVIEAHASAVEGELNGILNGLIILLTQAEAEQLRLLPGVKDIEVDQRLQVELDSSLPFLQVPEVWKLVAPNGSPVTGRGITVAVVDTGIDYTHPALGGCFGRGCKVSGGWDFVNNDPDPLDDHGHGTHVAGIIASADAVYGGVAPEATLLAYKTCDQSGSCYASHVISAINRAVEQGAQVINLSLSGEGKPDSPLLIAVDKAVEQGVIVVASAGNRGGAEDYRIGTPGNARSAITVGATDKAGQMATFSSRGGVWESFYKPDLAAPGLGIRSTYLDGQFISKDGTSMAAPHVSGVAALLAQLHPDWAPEQIKTSLMQTAKPSGAEIYDAFSEGAGLVQPVRAAHSRLSIEPGYLVHSLGAPTPTQTFSKNITVRNTGDGASSYTLGHASPGGVELSFTPALLSLESGDSREVRVNFTIVEASLGDSMNFSGYIHLQNTADPQDNYHLPYGLTRYVSASMEFDERPFVVILQERSPGSYRGNYFPNSQNYTIDLLKPGVYDFIIIYPSQAHFILRNGMQLYSSQSFAISKSEALRRVRLLYQDGDLAYTLDQDQTQMLSDALSYRGEPLYASSRSVLPDQVEYYFSDFLAGDYQFHLSALAKLEPGNDYYDFSYSLKSVTQDVDLGSDIANFNRVTVPLSAGGDQKTYTVVYSMTFNADSRLTFRQAMAEVSPESSLILHLSPTAEDDGSFSLRRISLCTTSNCYDQDFHSTRFYETPYLKSGTEQIDVFIVMSDGTRYPSDFVKISELQDATYPLNYYASFWNGQFANHAYRVNVNYAVSGFDWEIPYLRDWGGSMLVAQIDYKIYLEEALWTSGNLSAELANSPTKLVGWGWDLPDSGAVRIEMNHLETIETTQSPQTIVAEFDTSRLDPNPPTLQALAFCNNEKDPTNEGPFVYLYIEDESGIQKVDFSILAEGSASWQWLAGQRVNKNIFKVDLAGIGPVKKARIHFMAQDPTGNRLTQETTLPDQLALACPETLLGQSLVGYPIFLPISVTTKNSP